jgi:small-conductance mechanosensitive channel
MALKPRVISMELPKTLSDIFSTIDKVLHYQLFELNKQPVTLASLIVFVLIVIVIFFISRLLTRILLRRLLMRFHIESGIRFTMVRISHYILMIIGVIFAFQFVGVNLSGLAVIFGLLSVGIGFGLQNITSNFIAGLILLFERPIKVGDRITVGDTEGDVQAINMRSTTVNSLNNIAIIVPNSDFISTRVINWSYGDPKTRLVVDVGVSYNSDIDLVLKALREVAAENSLVLNYPEPDVLFRGFGDSSWNMQLRVWVADPKQYYTIHSEINIAIARKFREYNIEIPFPQRDLNVRSPLPVPFAASRPEE